MTTRTVTIDAEAAKRIRENVDKVLAPAERTGDELFDGSVYDDPRLNIEKNGRRVTDIEIGFSGTVPLGRYTVDDVEWHQGLKEGTEVELHVTALVAKTGFTFKKATENAGAKFVERKTLEVHTLEIAGGE